MKQRLEPSQPEKAARAFDVVNAAERIVKKLAIAGGSLDSDEIAVEDREMLRRLGDKFAQQLVHGAFLANTPEPHPSGRSKPPGMSKLPEML